MNKVLKSFLYKRNHLIYKVYANDPSSAYDKLMSVLSINQKDDIICRSYQRTSECIICDKVVISTHRHFEVHDPEIIKAKVFSNKALLDSVFCEEQPTDHPDVFRHVIS